MKWVWYGFFVVSFILLVSCSVGKKFNGSLPEKYQPTQLPNTVSPTAITPTTPPTVMVSPNFIQKSLTPTAITTPFLSQGTASPSATFGPYLALETYTPTVFRTTPVIHMTPNPSEMDIGRWESLSPNQNWMWYTQLIVQSADGKTIWTVVDLWQETGLGWSSPRPVGWSKDGMFFYFTNEPSIEGCVAINPNGSDLQSVDVETGKKVEVISYGASWISLSNDRSLLAYFLGNDLYIRDLNSDLEKNVHIDPGLEFELGYMIWSPDDQKLAFTLALSPCMGDFVGTGMFAQSSTIMFLDLATMQTTTLLEEDNRLLITTAWKDAKTIELKDSKNNKWIIDIQTKQLQNP